ncbi:FAD dependent oxidoreductase [Niveomyces insectorum RCEF 264]|uniref:FAD dependent oxidoreductase n=1 Tax=Niveomyces insectorum RCEF 264 TaxID=1081102 RepID=A0A167ZVI1_9HYPO|nr:FAD dependent oxidoreductase [Niveomyces insectorum RCEF 264]
MSVPRPQSILIIGSGVFGLSTAEALCRRPEFAHASITVVDRGSGDSPDGDGDDDDDDDDIIRHFPARDAASIDSSRIIRADYADPAYAALAAEAQAYWRGTKRRTVTGVHPASGNDDDDDYIGGAGRRELKVARHAYGYSNGGAEADADTAEITATTTASTPPPSAASTPLTHLDDPHLSIPAEGAADLRRGLRAMVPLAGLADRPFLRTRLCWYTDTPTADFLVDYHPDVGGLFVATGGSGHAFKFLPVLGDAVVACVLGERPAAFGTKWAWAAAAARRQQQQQDHQQQQQQAPSEGKNEAGAPPPPAAGWIAVITEDGSRGGRYGLVLRDELAKTGRSVG